MQRQKASESKTYRQTQIQGKKTHIKTETHTQRQTDADTNADGKRDKQNNAYIQIE